MRKFLVLMAVLLLCGGGLLFFLVRDADRLAALYTKKAMLLLQNRKDWPGFRIRRLDYGSVAVSWNGIAWRDITADLALKRENRVLENKDLHLSINRLSVRPENLTRQAFRLRASGVDVSVRDNGDQVKNQVITTLERATFALTFHLALPDREKSVALLKDLIQDLLQLRQTGYTRVVIDFSGQGRLTIHGTEVPVTLSAHREGDRYYLVLDRAALRSVSRLLEEELTEPEVALLAKVPLLTPELLEIRDKAVRESKALHRKLGISEDAYRHVLWSYLLTRAYGPDLAKKVTDAHEQGLTDNTEAEHRMDYQNNKVGREYALNSVAPQALLSRFRSDPAIIRSPEQIP